MQRRHPLAFAFLAAASAFMMPSPADAKVPSGVSGLVGSKVYDGQRALESQGYHRVSMSPGDDRSWSYWWNNGRKDCLSVVTMNGRFESIVETPSFDCNQSGTQAGGGTADGEAAAVVLGAAALIGAVALAHNSHHHEDGKHYNDQPSESEYERGFRDGLYSAGYHNYSRTDAYSRGYEDGSRQRGYETGYRPANHHGAGYTAYSSVDDLVYQDKDYARRELDRRGFRKVDSYRNESDHRVESYWNGGSGQCLAVTFRSGKVHDIHSMPKRNCR